MRFLLFSLLFTALLASAPIASPSDAHEVEEVAELPEVEKVELIPAKVGMTMLSKKQQKDLWIMVGRFAQIEIILESCKRRSNIERRVLRVASPCIERPTLKRIRRKFRNKLAYYRKRVIALDCQSKEVRTLLRAGKKAVDQVVSHVRKQCNACFFC